jgi:hypothetical protein
VHCVSVVSGRLCKDLFKTLTKEGYLTTQDFKALQKQQDRVHLPAELGAIPRKLGSSMDHLKGDQVLSQAARDLARPVIFAHPARVL